MYAIHYHSLLHSDDREALVETGLTRADIGDIASKIGQLYYSLYLRTSKSAWIREAYVFYEAIHARSYFDENGQVGIVQAVKQLKFYARFIIVCLLLNKKEVSGDVLVAMPLKQGGGGEGLPVVVYNPHQQQLGCSPWEAGEETEGCLPISCNAVTHALAACGCSRLR